MRKMLFFIAIAGLFFSCQREEGDPSFASDTTISVLPNAKAAMNTDNNALLGWVALTGKTDIPAEEAQATALATAMQMRKVEGIVTKAPLQIGSVEVVKGDTRKPYVATKGSKPEPADVYIINFANNQGYVVTSGDRRVPGVLAYNSYGHLGDTISNPGQAVLFSYMQAYIEEQREAFEANKEKLATQAEEALFKKLSKERQAELIAKGYFDKEGKRVKSKYDPNNPYSEERFNTHEEYWQWFCSKEENKEKSSFSDNKGYSIYGDLYTKYAKPPLIKTLWSQREAYNDKIAIYCDSKGDQPPVGCAAVAIGQLMAYHKKPAVFKDREMHWDDMTKVDSGKMFSTINSYNFFYNHTAKEDIQHLLAHLGDSDLLAMNYKCKSSSADVCNSASTLRKLGYCVTEKEFDNNSVIDQIKKNNPIYVRGDAIKKSYHFLGFNICNDYTGHAWIMDGFVEQSIPVKTFYVFSCVEDDATTSYEMTYEETNYLIHHNFGWGGYETGAGAYSENNLPMGTGWYNLGIFSSRSGRKYSSNAFKSNSDGNYKHDVQIIYVIK